MVFDQSYDSNHQGVCGPIALQAPHPSLSLDRWQTKQPYACYTVEVSTEGYDIEEREDVQIFADQYSTLYVEMSPSKSSQKQRHRITIEEHSLSKSGDPYA